MTSKLTFNTVVSMIETNRFISYGDENNNPNQLVRKRVGIDFYTQCFNIIKDQTEPKVNELKEKKVESLKKLGVLLSQNQNDRYLPLINSINNTISKLQADVEGFKKFFKNVKQDLKFDINLTPSILTHAVLDSLVLNDHDYNKLEEGLYTYEGIAFLRVAINRFLKKESETISNQSFNEFNSILKALMFGLHYNIIEIDYDENPSQLQNHAGLLMHLLSTTLKKKKYVFIPLATHSHIITLIVSKIQNKYRIKVINTGEGCKQLDIKTVSSKYSNDLKIDEKRFIEYFTCEMIYENLTEADLDNMINQRLKNFRSFSSFFYKFSSTLTSKTINRKDGDLHHAQLGYSCVLKSMMRGIHGSISSEIDFLKFKIHMTKYLINLASNNKNYFENTQPLIGKMIDDAQLILRKREIKLKIAELSNSSESNSTSLKLLKDELKLIPQRFPITNEND